jgi:hypothetical protein
LVRTPEIVLGHAGLELFLDLSHLVIELLRVVVLLAVGPQLPQASERFLVVMAAHLQQSSATETEDACVVSW